MKVRPKKHLGQHFLRDENIAYHIVDALSASDDYDIVLEIGPGMGVLTDFLLKKDNLETYLIELDKESVVFLHKKYPQLKERIIGGDFLKLDLDTLFDGKFSIIGNFPYNISSQIFFKVLEYREQVFEVVCMLQKEVAERIASPKGKKSYGILSVLLQAYYDIEYLFTVEPEVFDPPPKVRSAVIRLVRNDVVKIPCNERLFKTLIKEGFQNRRKTLRNALKRINLPDEFKTLKMLDKRAEQLSVDDFIELTNKLESFGTNHTI